MILSKVRRELSAASDEGKRQAGLRYFREEVNLYGISASTRTALRYAIEKMPQDLRMKAMER